MGVDESTTGGLSWATNVVSASGAPRAMAAALPAAKARRAARSASRISPAFRKRRAGSLASARSTTWTTGSGIPGTHLRIGSGSWSSTWYRTVCRLSASNGLWPTRSS